MTLDRCQTLSIMLLVSEEFRNIGDTSNFLVSDSDMKMSPRQKCDDSGELVGATILQQEQEVPGDTRRLAGARRQQGGVKGVATRIVKKGASTTRFQG